MNPHDLHPDRDILSARTLDAPRERVFDAFVDPARLARWWGPAGFRNTLHVFEPRPGGAWRGVMHAPDGRDFPTDSVFVEIERPSRIVFRHVSPEHPYELVSRTARDERIRGTATTSHTDPARSYLRRFPPHDPTSFGLDAAPPPACPPPEADRRPP